MRFFISIPVLAAGSLLSCATGDTEKNYTSAVLNENKTGSAQHSDLVINEFSPKSRLMNEFDEEADWVELYNCLDQPLLIENAEWSMTDDESEPLKYILPDTIIPPHGYLLIWCDDRVSESAVLHAGFKLAGGGETVYLFHNEQPADDIVYDDDIKKAHSYGRMRDGGADWIEFKQPTPGFSNSFENYTEAR